MFPIRKEGIFCPGKEIKGLRGGVPLDPPQTFAAAKVNSLGCPKGEGFGPSTSKPAD